jgi:hypothetical protein
LAITLAIVAFTAAILLSIAGMGGFDPPGGAISDPPEGTVTQSVENPARPEHPGFPPPPDLSANNNNNSLPSEVNGNPPVAQGLVESILQHLILLAISK